MLLSQGLKFNKEFFRSHNRDTTLLKILDIPYNDNLMFGFGHTKNLHSIFKVYEFRCRFFVHRCLTNIYFHKAPIPRALGRSDMRCPAGVMKEWLMTDEPIGEY